MNFLYPDLITMTVSIPMDFMCLKSASHSFSPQFWWGMSCEISSRNVPVILSPWPMGTISPPVSACPGNVVALPADRIGEFSALSMPGAAIAEAAATAAFFRNDRLSVMVSGN